MRKKTESKKRKALAPITYAGPEGTQYSIEFNQVPGFAFEEPEHSGPSPTELGEDWRAWRDAYEAHRPWNFYPLSPNAPSFSDAALEALRRSVRFESIEPLIDASYARLAVALTIRFQAFRIMGTTLGAGFGDVVVSALNRYPEVASTAATILVPALRNLLREPRESPDELWAAWANDERRLRRLILHPHSTLFQGRSPRHLLLDYTDPSYRTAQEDLERWRIRVHLFDIPKDWHFEKEYWLEPEPPVSVPRLNALARCAAEMLGGHAYKSYRHTTCRFLFHYLLHEGGNSRTTARDRKQFREAVGLLHDATMRGLTKRFPHQLTYEHVASYDNYLRSLTAVWSATRMMKPRARTAERWAHVLGLANPYPLDSRLSQHDIDSMPRSHIAATILTITAQLPQMAPEVVLQKLSEPRKVEAAFTGKRLTRRGRPPKSRGI